MIFDGIYGHNEVKKRLSDAAQSNTVSHAYIFSGKNGIGKTAVAKAFADHLTNGSEADIIYVSNEYYGVRDKASLSVEAVRAARTDVYTKPYLAEKRVFIVPNADTMTAAAQNALLKVFEEPPSFCIFILLTHSENSLLPTIRSRAVTIRFSPLPDDIVAQYLTDKYKVSDPLVIRLSGGSIANADAFYSQESVIDTAKEFAAIFQKIASGNETAVFEAIAYFDSEKSSYAMLLDIMEMILEDCLLNNKHRNDIISIGRLREGAVVEIIDNIENARRALQTNRNYNMVITELLLGSWRILND